MICMYVCTYVCAYVCTHMYVRTYVCTYICMYIRIYVCMYVCMYVLCMYVLCMYVLCTYVQTKAAQFTNHTKDSDWETLAQCRTTARLCTLSKMYSGERDWEAIFNRLRRPYYLSGINHVQKIRDRKQRTDI